MIELTETPAACAAASDDAQDRIGVSELLVGMEVGSGEDFDDPGGIGSRTTKVVSRTANSI